MQKYQDLDLEVRRIHGATRVTMIPIVVGALGTISVNAKASYRRLSLPDIFGSAQYVSHHWYCPHLAESVVFKLWDCC